MGPTLQELTVAHSRRLSELHQQRDAALRDALVVRDSELRALPEAQALYARFDKAVNAAGDDRAAIEHKAAAARDTALARALEARTESLADTARKRRVADLDALDRHAESDAAADQKFREGLAELTSTAELELRYRTIRELERLRQQARDEARDAYARALTTAQTAYRRASENALIGERTAERAAENAFVAARRAAAASEAAALGNAERELFVGLQALAGTRDALEHYRATVNRIRVDARIREQRVFAQFRDELLNAESKS